MKLRGPSLNSFQMLFGLLIHEHRIKAGLTLEDVQIRVFGAKGSASAVKDTESGRFEPKADKIARFQAALEIPESKLEDIRHRPPWPQVFSPKCSLYREVIGRSENIEDIRKAIEKDYGEEISPWLVLEGSAAIGKTTVARAVVERFRKYFYGIWFVRADSSETAISDLADLAAALGIQPSSTTTESLAKAALSFLQSTRDPWLLIFDNARNSSSIAEWRIENPIVYVVVTSQSGNWPKRLFRTFRIPQLEPPHAVTLLMKEAQRNYDHEPALRLTEALDCIPLALVVAAAWLRDRPSVSFSQYQHEIEARIAELPDTVGDYGLSLLQTLQLSIDSLSNNARSALSVLSFFSPDEIPTSLLYVFNQTTEVIAHEWFDQIPAEHLGLLKSRALLEGAIAELNRANLISINDGKIGVHRTTQIAVRKGLDESFETWIQIAATMLAAQYPSGGAQNPQFQENWKRCELLNPHVSNILQLRPRSLSARSFDHLASQAGLYHWRQDNLNLSLKYAITALRCRLAEDPINTRDVGEALSNLAAYLGTQGKLFRAVTFSSQAIRLADAEAVPDADRAIWYGCHGFVLNRIADQTEKLSEYQLVQFAASESRRYHHKALHLHKSVYGIKSRQACIHIRNIAKTYETRGEHQKALFLHKYALRVRRKILQSFDADVGISAVDVGALLLLQGELVAARRLLIEAMTIFETAFPNLLAHHLKMRAAHHFAVYCLLSSEKVVDEPLFSAYSDDIDWGAAKATASAVFDGGLARKRSAAIND